LRSTARASFEGRGGDLGARDLTPFYGTADSDVALDVLNSRPEGADEGTFVLLVSRNPELDAAAFVPRNFVFAVDVSGSMFVGDRLSPARDALRRFLGSLDPRDAFNVVTDSTDAEALFSTCVPVTPENLQRGLELADALRPEGATILVEALRVSLASVAASAGRMPLLILLTDGLPTVGTARPDRILEHVERWNASAARVFVFGVGNDVNTKLLDTLAERSDGARTYVRHGGTIDRAAGELFTRVGVRCSPSSSSTCRACSCSASCRASFPTCSAVDASPSSAATAGVDRA
jgi:Ca-activated chloride channel family protein